jgi:tyrosine-protein kinase Etk/Wzc
MRGQSLKLIAGADGNYALYGQEKELLLRGRMGELATADLGGDEQLTILVSELQGEPDQEFRVWRSSRVRAVQSLQGRLNVAERTQWSGMLEISVQGPDPDQVRAEVDAVADAYVAQNIARKTEEAQRTLDFLNKQLPEVQEDLDMAGSRLNEFRAREGSIDLTIETQTILNRIVTVEAKVNELRQEREKVTLAFTTMHPTVVALDRQIEQLRQELDGLNEQVRELPETQQEQLGLVRDVEVNTALYTSLLSMVQELRVVKAGTVGNVRVIDYAIKPTRPIRPNKSRIMLIAFLLGIVVGVAAALVRRALSAGVDDPDLVEKHVNVPVYATIAHSKRQEQIYKALKSKEAKRAILAIDKPDDLAIESLANLRTALHFGMMEVKNNCIMIAGPGPHVGKSFISVNLAAVLASNEKKVLLIDGDLRRGHLHEYLGIKRENGLSEFISGEIPIGDAIHQTTVPGLSLVPTGVLPPNPAELLLHQRFANCINVLGPRYDHIIIDSPPILAVTDATIIGQMAGGTLMVLKAGEHPMREIELAVKRLQQASVNLRGILLNDVPVQSRSYGVGKYYYQYSYKKD